MTEATGTADNISGPKQSSSSTDCPMIRPMQQADLDRVVDIHLRSFPGFFLTFLGRNFLRLLYKSIHRDQEGIVLVALSSQRIIGFVAGVTHQSGFYKRLIRHELSGFVLASLRAFLRRPSIAPRLFRALRRSQESKQASAEACLLSIAVLPDAENRGTGRHLVKALCRVFFERGVTAMSLTTDQENNERINRFYQQLGFRVSRTFVTPEGRAMNEYYLSLPLDD